MKHTKKNYIGIDISKRWFDLTLITKQGDQTTATNTQRFDNNPEGIAHLHQWLDVQKVSRSGDTLVLIENTGIHQRLLWNYCTIHRLPLHIGNAADLKLRMGISRGKNDQVDSQRLANLALRYADQLLPTAPYNILLEKIKALYTSRAKLQKEINSIKVYLSELKASGMEKAVQQTLEEAYANALKGLKESFVKIEKLLAEAIRENDSIYHNYKLLCTVPGIGHLTATYLICCTSNFLLKVSGKQLASYAGVVPFEHSSGSSIKGKNRVHHMANKNLKKLLHLGALSAIQYYPEMKDYYQRKLQEGKHTFCVLNAIRNKIVLRAAAVINNQQPYVENYRKAA